MGGNNIIKCCCPFTTTSCPVVVAPFGISDVTGPTNDFVANLMPGRYRITYYSGGMNYGLGYSDDDWYVNGVSENGYSLRDAGGTSLLNDIFGPTMCPSPTPGGDGDGGHGGYDNLIDLTSQSESAGAPLTDPINAKEFVLGATTAVYLWFRDEDYRGNANNTVRFRICKVTEGEAMAREGRTLTASPYVGPGTFLSRMMAAVGIHHRAFCRCGAMAAVMDAFGPSWCAENKGQIIEVMREGAAERGIPFAGFGASMLLRVAIRRSQMTIS